MKWCLTITIQQMEDNWIFHKRRGDLILFISLVNDNTIALAEFSRFKYQVIVGHLGIVLTDWMEDTNRLCDRMREYIPWINKKVPYNESNIEDEVNDYDLLGKYTRTNKGN
eukprot:gnl/Chilomastix_caulleri/5181.p1 GENE.gnl/Chilomastix_caulleri/5181~~gnl/Chilomastix_caulleri/5181.p1  ORF type:complete len:111 (-),score=14.45 gnl/Chilomastix_caulleri/5181:60-392(-)